MQTMTTKRMENPAAILPDAMKALPHLFGAIRSGGVPDELLELVALRVSQINGCGACVYGHVARLRQLDVSNERIDSIAVWRHAPFYNEQEQAALQLAEAATRLADAPGEAVCDFTWGRARERFDDPQLAALLLEIALINFFNRINVTIQEPASTTW